MPNLDFFGHVFAAMFHINIAAVGLLIFFYKSVYDNIRERFTTSKESINNIRIALSDNIATKINGNIENENPFVFAFTGFKWLFHMLLLYLIVAPIFYFSRKEFEKIKSESDYIKRYFPLFFVIGIYCLLMLISSALISSFETDKPTPDYVFVVIHYSKIIILGASIFTFTFTILTIIALTILRKNNRLITLNFIILLISFEVMNYLFTHIDYHFFHTTCKDHDLIFLFSVILITIFPTINIIRKCIMYTFSGHMASYYNKYIQDFTDKIMDKNLHL